MRHPQRPEDGRCGVHGGQGYKGTVTPTSEAPQAVVGDMSNDAGVSTEIQGAWCAGCGEPLLKARPDDPTEGRTPCPTCGSLRRMVRVQVQGAVTLQSDLALKKNSPGFKERKSRAPSPRAIVGRSTERGWVWRDRQRVVDRENNRYIERVTNPDGAVIHDVDEPLDQHLGHGSDIPLTGRRGDPARGSRQ